MKAIAPQTVTPAVIAANPNSAQGGRKFNLPIPAGETVRANGRGTQAYLIIATADVNMRPLGGDFETYSVGTGIDTNVAFDYVEIQNFQPFPVVISLWIGFDSFIDNRLILANANNPNIIFPTYPEANAATFVNIVDLSGGAFTDADGNKWLALYRVAILFFSLEPSPNSFPLQSFMADGSSSGIAVAIIPPAPLPLRLDINGDYTYNEGGAPVNAVISEIYSAIPAIA